MAGKLSYYDRQFQFAEILPDFTGWLDWVVRQSAGTTGWTRHAYGPDPRQWIDARPSEGGDIAPFFIHGGYWRAVGAQDCYVVAEGLGGLGPMVAVAEYRLIPAARMADLVADAVAGLDTLARLLPDCRILPIGHSAGAHLAFWATQLTDLPAERIAGVVGLSGIYDLAPIADCFLQADLSLTDAEVRDFSPLRTRPRPGIRRLLITGEQETGLYHQQAGRMAQLCGADLAEVEHAHHMSILSGLSAPDLALSKAIRAFALERPLPKAIAGSGISLSDPG